MENGKDNQPLQIRIGPSAYRVMQATHALRARGPEVARNEPLDANFLCCKDCILLLRDSQRYDRADDDADSLENLLQGLDTIVQVTSADLDSGRAKLLYLWL